MVLKCDLLQSDWEKKQNTIKNKHKRDYGRRPPSLELCVNSIDTIKSSDSIWTMCILLIKNVIQSQSIGFCSDIWNRLMEFWLYNSQEHTHIHTHTYKHEPRTIINQTMHWQTNRIESDRMSEIGLENKKSEQNRTESNRRRIERQQCTRKWNKIKQL